MIYTAHKSSSSAQIKNDGVGGECGKVERCLQGFGGET
jgi:hypothetical protein